MKPNVADNSMFVFLPIQKMLKNMKKKKQKSTLKLTFKRYLQENGLVRAVNFIS